MYPTTSAVFRLKALRGKPMAKPLIAELPSEAVKPTDIGAESRPRSQ